MDAAQKPRIGIALGSGSARGWGHIGVLNRLEELGIRPDIVIGSSVGALVGAAYASGNLAKLEAWARTLARLDIIRLLDPRLSGGGFIHGESLMGAIAEHVADCAIEDLPMRFACVATDLTTGQEVWLNQGSVLDAVRASIALPGVFTPVRRDERWLIDGGLVNPVPVSLARAMGADLIIAVNLNGDLVGRSLRPAEAPTPVPSPEAGNGEASALSRVLTRFNDLKDRFSLDGLLGLGRDTAEGPAAPGLFDVLTASINIMQDRITRSRMAGDPPDVLITPRLSPIRLMEFDRAAEAIAEGVKAVNRRHHELDLLLNPTA
ncbi:MAG: patatin-like phospholipase RssA [Gammaproteobacteria bacterium]|nr:patatin-like phospholipase RssA [Gammaproteobacteria bacterium]